MPDQNGTRSTGQATAGTRHPGLHHRDELRRPELRGKNRAGARRDHGRYGDLFGRRRYDPRRTPLLIEMVLSVHSIALRIQPASPDAGRRCRILYWTGLQSRTWWSPDGAEGNRPGRRNALAACRHRSTLPGAPPGLAGTGRSFTENSGSSRSY